MHAGQPVPDEHDREQRRGQCRRPSARRPSRSTASRRAQHRQHARRGQQRHRDPVIGRGSRTSAPTMASTAAMRTPRPARRRCRRRSTAATNATSSGNVGAAMRAACSQIQSLPSCTGSDAADRASMNADQQHRDAVGDDRRKHDQRHQHQQAEVLGVPAPGQDEAAAADHRGDAPVRRERTPSGRSS